MNGGIDLEPAQQIRRLLRSTYDEAGWYRDVMALKIDEAIPILVGVVSDEQDDLDARRYAALILGLLRDARGVDALLQALQAPDRVLRGQAAGALGNIENVDDRVIQQLIGRLEDEDYFVRECAAKALGQLKRVQALPALMQMSAADSVSTNQSVAQQAIEAIQKVT
jgi:HEAT repeat protein